MESSQALISGNAEQLAKLYLPAVPELETEQLVAFTWKITDWGALPARAVGPKFEAGGHTWRLLVFPEGNGANGNGRISLFLKICDPNALDAAEPETLDDLAASHESTPKAADADADAAAGVTTPGSAPSTAAWHACAQFTLVMWNPNHPEAHVAQSAYHRYTAKSVDWGYASLTDLRGALTRGNKPAALIENGHVNVTAIVRVLKDPTGILWHDFIDYDSKQETGYVGLANQGATCYLNSLLQSLYFTQVFRQAVYKIPEGSAVTGGLQRLFYLLTSSNQPVSTSALTRAFGWDTADAFTQHDVQELNRVLMDKLESKMKGTDVDGILNKIFVGQMKSFIKCVNVDFESSRTEDFWDIQLNVKGVPSVEESFKEYIKPEMLEGDNQYQATGFGLQDAKKGVIFESFPPVLHLQLKRFDYDFERDMEVKINDRYEFPMDLDLAAFVDPDSEAAKQAKARGQSWQYDLHAVLVHSGDLNAGHYYTLIKPDADGDWFRFDDDRVTRATSREVLEDNYGGEGPSGRGPKRITSAYMLVYLRKCMLDFVLPSTSDVLPVGLPALVEAEQAAEEKRRREMLELRQYLQLRVMGEQQFRRHVGIGLAPWESRHSSDPSLPVTVAVRRALRIGDLPKFISDAAAAAATAAANTKAHDDAPAGQAPQTPQETGNSNGDGSNGDGSSGDGSSSPGDANSPLPATVQSVWLVATREYAARRAHLLEPEHALNKVEELTQWSESSWPTVWAETKPGDPKTQHLIFIKHFSVPAQQLAGRGTVWASSARPLGESLRPVLTELPGANLYREAQGLLSPLDRSVPVSDQLNSGDVVVVETGHPLAGTRQGRAADYFSFLRNAVTLAVRGKGDPEDAPPLLVAVSRQEDYATLVKRIALESQVQPEFMQLWPDWGNPRGALRSDGRNLREFWALGKEITVYLDILDRPLVELEQLREVPLLWVGPGAEAEDGQASAGFGADPILLPVEVAATGTVADLLEELGNQFAVDASNVKLWTARHGRLARHLGSSVLLSDLSPYDDVFAAALTPEEKLVRGAVLRAQAPSSSPEAVSLDETAPTPAPTPAENFAAANQLVSVIQFHKDAYRIHSVPFSFVVKRDEPFKATRERLAALLGTSDKFKVAVLEADAPPRYIEKDEAVLFSELGDGQILGLDRQDKRRPSHHQQALVIN